MIALIPSGTLFPRVSIRRSLCCLFLGFWILPVLAGYKVRPYEPLPIENYPSKLTSEGLTVAVDPMFTDKLAAKVFDKKDVVKRGIMPLAIIIFNSNEFAVEVEAGPIELIGRGNRIQAVSPDIAFRRIFQRTYMPPQEVRIPSPVPFPRTEITIYNEAAYDDFLHKYLGFKRIEPESMAAGFIYLPVENVSSLRQLLAEAQIYIPDLYRVDTGAAMMFLEIALKPAIDAARFK